MLLTTFHVSPCFFITSVSKGLAVLREVVLLVPGHLGARLSMARAFYCTGQADSAHQTLQARKEIPFWFSPKT